MQKPSEVTPDNVLSFWFPDDLASSSDDEVADFWATRMHGGMDEAITRDYADLTRAAAEGVLDHWADTAPGRLALILVLDQFPRSLWRDTPAAYGQDIKAARLALEGLDNGHYNALPHMFQRQFYVICISHCEGPDHHKRMDLCVRLNEDFHEIAGKDQVHWVERGIAQAKRVRDVIARFGRHPHRNEVLGRLSTPDEQAYIATGDFPHVRKSS